MYPKKIKYTDFNGTERERTFLFNLTEAELIEMQSSVDGGLAEYGRRIIECQNVPELMKLFKELILMSYGEKSADGNRFIKNDPVRGRLADEFMQTNAYSELYMEFLNNPESAAEFFNNVIPAKLQEEIEKDNKKDNAALPMAAGHAYPPSVAKA